MAKIKLPTFVKSICSFTKKHDSAILMGFGITASFAAVVTAVVETPKALKSIEDRKEELETDTLDGKEIVKAAAPHYILPLVIEIISVACLLGSASANNRKNVALMAAYSLSESTLKDYRSKVVETIGEEKEHDIHEKVVKEKVKKEPQQVNAVTDCGGDTLCYDVISCRYFKSSKGAILEAVQELSNRIISDDCATLNDFYYLIGLDESKIGDDLGWCIDKGGIKVDFSSDIDKNGKPYLIIDYMVAPFYDFR